MVGLKKKITTHKKLHWPMESYEESRESISLIGLRKNFD